MNISTIAQIEMLIVINPKFLARIQRPINSIMIPQNSLPLPPQQQHQVCQCSSLVLSFFGMIYGRDRSIYGFCSKEKRLDPLPNSFFII